MRAPAAPALLFALALVALAGCQGGTADDGGGDDGGDTGGDTSQGSDTDAGGDESGDDGGDAAGGDCADPVLTDPPSTAGDITITADSMSPSTLEISVGDVVGFLGGDDGFHGLLVGSLASVTVTDSIPEYYRFDGAGTCQVADELGTGTATITVG